MSNLFFVSIHAYEFHYEIICPYLLSLRRRPFFIQYTDGAGCPLAWQNKVTLSLNGILWLYGGTVIFGGSTSLKKKTNDGNCM